MILLTSCAASAQPFERLTSILAHHQSIGRTGMVPIDLDGDGVDEVVFASGGEPYWQENNAVWSVQYFAPRRNEYEIRWQSPEYDPPISLLTAFRLRPSGSAVIAIGTASGDVEIFDGGSRERLAHAHVSSGPIRAIFHADADNDGSEDVVAVGTDGTWTLDPVSLAVRNTIPHGSACAAAANVDADEDVELVYCHGLVVQQNASATAVEWDYSRKGFGESVQLEDVDDDGRPEIVALRDDAIKAYDAVSRTVQWTRRSTYGFDAFLAANVTGDATVEILASDSFLGVTVVDAVSGAEQWRIEAPYESLSRMTVAETDGDDRRELLGVIGLSSTAPDYLKIRDVVTGAVEWTSTTSMGPYTAVDAGDTTGDVRAELVTASRSMDDYHDDAVLTVRDGKSLAVQWQTEPDFSGDFGGLEIHDVLLHDLTGDGTKEILVSGRAHDGAALLVIDGLTRVVVLSQTYPEGGVLRSLAVGDIDADGDTEIVAVAVVSGAYYYGSSMLWVLDASDGALRWSALVGSGPEPAYDVGVANIDGDRALEIVLLYRVLTIFDGITKQFWIASGGEYSAFTFVPGGKKDLHRIAATTTDGRIRRINGPLRTRRIGAACDAPAAAIRELPQGRFLVACGSRLRVFDTTTGTVTWTSEDLGAGLGGDNNLAIWRAGGALRVAAGSSRRVEVLVETD